MPEPFFLLSPLAHFEGVADAIVGLKKKRPINHGRLLRTHFSAYERLILLLLPANEISGTLGHDAYSVHFSYAI